ncbi:MAG: fatty acid desaturase [Proteobacteria bacterium]|nr:fatty acid desaturase [Pseudomonadota bacterium]
MQTVSEKAISPSSKSNSKFTGIPIVTGFNWTTILWVGAMHLGTVAALFFFSWKNVAAAFTLYLLTGCIGITLTYHRLLAHRTFVVPKWLERTLASVSALAMEGGPIKWIAHHRMHHANPDTDRDPHNSRRGFFYCHMGWTMISRPEFDDPELHRRYARDIYADPYFRFLETTAGQFLPQVLLAALLLAIGGWSMILWGVCLRMVAVYHATWCVNSATHFFGYRTYEMNDEARNTWWVALVTFGEGWHNNHHAHQHAAEAGHKWWEIDVTMMVIRLLAVFGLATKIKSYKNA